MRDEFPGRVVCYENCSRRYGNKPANRNRVFKRNTHLNPLLIEGKVLAIPGLTGRRGAR
ncbi:hypothetical protein MNBD_NITROSPIRAE03-1926 [hydrothermal vent metagenome]|uniref:Uncharacterized protein n=1 Tax=hydrothermal vent metagenome TaxID=652676 RepID=A0A3B1CC53_9ZZZZ